MDNPALKSVERGYKVVESIGGELWSYNDYYKIPYLVGEWTVPTVGKLFYFEKLEHAENLIYYRQNYHIYSCEVVNGKELTYKDKILSMSESNPSIIEKFWRAVDEFTEYFYYYYSDNRPNGTYLCDKLRLIERV